MTTNPSSWQNREADVLTRLLDGRHVELPIGGSSMWPCLEAGDRVTVEPRTRVPRIGQIALAVHQGALVAHRVIAANSDGVILQGDNAPLPDRQFQHAAVFGIVVRAQASNGAPKPLFDSSLQYPIYARLLPVIRYLRRVVGQARRRMRGE